ncbi:MAG: amino acid ABC transporter substrate-binding protein [Chitinophagaceae bacterium]|nr:MAG: amino acid ABC transporter substrate-binding protein [Chitinophagaceae bacterium]
MHRNIQQSFRNCRYLFVLLCLLTASAAQVSAQKQKIALFAPLYLDSAFDGSNSYRYTKNTFPKFINPGLEFYEGAQLAIDSLNMEGAELEIYIYDTRSASENLQQILAKPAMADMDLVIAHCSGNEVRSFAEFGLKNNIPVINATVPNDAGTTSNPYFVLLNPTLKTQCEGIYQYAQKYYSTAPIVVFRRKGASDDLVKNLFDEYAKSTTQAPLKLKYVELADSFTVYQLRAQLDSNKKSLCIAGSLDMNFGKRLSAQLASISKRYPLTIMGMPTWDGIREFSRPEFKGPEIIYSTPFYNSKTDKVSLSITNYFNTFMFSRPSDMVFRGYEVTWKYAKLLAQYKQDLASNLGNKQHRVFTDYDVQPVINKRTETLDYFENKKLYFLKWQDGLIKAVY